MAMKIRIGLYISPKKPKRKGDELADRGGDFGGAHIAELARQRGAQHAAAVHRKGRDQVEQRQEQIDHRQPVDQRNLHIVDGDRGARLQMRAGQQQQGVMATFTSGPAMAMRNSSHGSSGMRSSCATPPIGSSVT